MVAGGFNPRRGGPRLLLALPWALATGAAVALAGALAAGRHRLFAYPDLFLFDLLAWLAWTVPLAVLFLLLADLLAPLAGRFRLPRWVAALVAALPVLAAAGWHANRAWGIRPSALLGLAPYAVSRNVGLVAAGCLVAGIAAWVLERRPPQPQAGEVRRAARFSVAIALAGLGLWAALAGWFATAGPKPRPDVVVLLIDAARADRFGTYGYERATTPAIDAFARDAIVFRQAVAASTFTKSSVASIFTGRHPYQHGVFQGSAREMPGRVTSDLLSPGETTLAEALRDRGVLTQGWVQNSHLLPFMGFAQGFVDYRADQGEAARIGRRFGHWLGGPGRRHPFFAYVHLIDLHDPYRPQPPYDAMFGAGGDPYAGLDLDDWGSYLDAVRRGEVVVEPERLARMSDLYDGQLRQVDDQVGRVLARLKRLGLYDDALIVVTSDHGDAFGEHGFIAHSAAPYEELVRVPLIVKLPGNRFAGRTVERPVRLVDLYPTVLDALGAGERGEKSWVGSESKNEPGAGLPVDLPGLGRDVELPRGDELAGCSLVALLRSDEPETAPRDPACDLAVTEIAEDDGEPTVGLRTARWKYFLRPSTGVAELYDLASDPAERMNLLATGEVVVGEGAEVAAAAFHRLALEIIARRAETGTRQIELDERLIEEMKSLGYLKG